MQKLTPKVPVFSHKVAISTKLKTTSQDNSILLIVISAFRMGVHTLCILLPITKAKQKKKKKQITVFYETIVIVIL